jgi:hypothetical protein
MTVLSRAGQKSGRPAEKRRSGPKEQQIIDLEQELKQVCEAAAADKKRLEDELADEKRKAMEANAQFNTLSIGRSNLCVDDFIGVTLDGILTVTSRRLPQP